MVSQWKTIDNYYQKKLTYKINKLHNPIPSQGNIVGKKIFIENGVDGSDYDTHIISKTQNVSTKGRRLDVSTIDQHRLRETKMNEIYATKNNRSIESSRNRPQKIK